MERVESFSEHQSKWAKIALLSQNEQLVNSFPLPENFISFLELEQAVLDWKNQMEEIIGDIHIPNVMGRHYFRPRVSLASTVSLFFFPTDLQGHKGSSASEDSFDLNSTDDESPESLSVIKRVSSDPEFVYRRRAVSDPELIVESISLGVSASRWIENAEGEGESDGSYKDSEDHMEAASPFVLDHDPWEATLIPPEPRPEHYTTFEEYEKAMQRWAFICSNLSFLPPHPSQLQDLLDIIPAKEVYFTLINIRKQTTTTDVLKALHRKLNKTFPSAEKGFTPE